MISNKDLDSSSWTLELERQNDTHRCISKLNANTNTRKPQQNLHISTQCIQLLTRPYFDLFMNTSFLNNFTRISKIQSKISVSVWYCMLRSCRVVCGIQLP